MPLLAFGPDYYFSVRVVHECNGVANVRTENELIVRDFNKLTTCLMSQFIDEE